MFKLLLIILLFITTSCSNFSNLIAEKSSSVKLEGERVTILKLENDLTPSNQIRDVEISIPEQLENNSWSNSNGSEYDYYDNLKLPKEFQSCTTHHLNIARKSYVNITPVIVDNFMFVMNSRSEVIAYQDNNYSKPIWIKNTMPIDEKKDYIGGGIAYADEKLFITAGHRDVIALNAKNGKEIWRHSLNNIIRAAPIFSNNTLFVVTIDNKLYAIDSYFGNVRWMHEGASESIGIFGSASIATNGKVVIIPHSSGQLHGLDIATGEEIWSVNLAFNKNTLMGFSFSDIDITPVIRDGIAYVAGNTGSLYAIQIENGVPLWHKNIKGIKSLWVAGQFIYIINDSNELLSIYIKNGNIKWVKELSFNSSKKSSNKVSLFGPIFAGNMLLFSSNLGKLFFISPYNGDLIKEISIPKNVTAIPIVASSKLFILSDNGTLNVCQ